MSVFDYPAHPVAEIFPMLGDDELDELAEDIKVNGLNSPLVVKDGVLIDGRNRREACRRAGVTPATTELDGQDPAAYIISSNIQRRHLTKGQRAMAVAMIYPEPKRGQHAEYRNDTGAFSNMLLSRSRTVLKWAPELADGVLAGAESLDKAYETALDRKTKAEGPALRLKELRARDPDLADKVVEENLSLDDAEGAARSRRQRERERRAGITNGLVNINEFMLVLRDQSHRQFVFQICREHPEELDRKTLVTWLQEWRASIDTTLASLRPPA